MLSRRHLRIKALQALYAYYINPGIELAVGEKNMLKSTEKIYELIIYQLSFLIEIVKFAARRIEENKKKFYPTEEDLNPNTRFINNQLIAQLSENKDYIRRHNAYKINWSEEQEMVRRIYNEVRESEGYKKYMSAPETTFEDDQAIIALIFTDFVADNPSLAFHYEEKNVYWANDLEIANPIALKIIRSMRARNHEFTPLPDLYNTKGKDDPDEDKKFLVRLYHKTILKGQDFEDIIQKKASNWELNRIAMMDIILLKMALAELIEFPSIPVKVTMNEYIELAKSYSTPKSRVFINGILDKIILDLKAEDRIKKAGRGLIE
ncbi:MAG: transcription antitermination factor NusB [Bacteroidales bacterium]